MSESSMSGVRSDLAGRRRAVVSEPRRYLFRHLLMHLEGVTSPDRVRALLDKLEGDEFLAKQASQPDGFEACARQLERYVLPATVRSGDWRRFFRYLLTAVTLRRLGRTLDDPTILRALARSGRLPLAEAFVDRLPSSPDRARGWAVLASITPPTAPEFGRLAEALRRELDKLPGSAEASAGESIEAWTGALETAARLLAPRLRARWSEWIGRLAPWPDRADRVRVAVAEGFFDAGEPDASELWKVLAAVEDRKSLVELLPDRLADRVAGGGLERGAVLRERLGGAGDDERLLWAIGLASLAGCERSPEREWRKLRIALGAPRWDEELLERGAKTWPRLAEEDLREVASKLSSPDLHALLRVLVLEGRRDRASFRSTLTLLDDPSTGERQLSLYLRALVAAPDELSREVRSRVKSLLVHLADVQYAVPPEDLSRALDLTAALLPRRLRRVIDGALSAPGSGGQVLLTVAGRAEDERLLSELLERAETYAALAAADAAEGFELREKALVLLCCRVMERGADLQVLEGVAGRLLPEEEDRLRERVARLLSRSASEQRRELAGVVCSGIREPALRLRVRLETLPEDADPGGLVAPGSLYRVAARWPPVEDALRALGALLEEPRRPARLAGEHLGEIQNLGRKVEALADVARHALAFQAKRFQPMRQDRPAALLPLKEALGVVESDRWLVSLTPELVRLGAHLGLRQAVAEVQEAVERVSAFDSVEPTDRVAILVEILAGIEGPFVGEEPGAPLGHVRRTKRRRGARELLLWLAHFPERAGETPHGLFLRSAWHRLLPVLVAIWERRERRAGRSPRPSGWLDRVRPGVRGALEESARFVGSQCPGRRPVFDLCLEGTEERLAVATELLAGGHGARDADTVCALAWLLADERPEIVPGLVARLDPGESRDCVALELVRHAPLPLASAGELLRLLSTGEGGSREWGDVWLGLRYPGASRDCKRWSAAVAALVARDRIDLADPATIPIRRRLWALGPEGAEGSVAEAALGALARGGADGGERAARLFLNAFVRPRLGEAAGREARERLEQMVLALEQARSLEDRPEPEPDDPGDAEPGTGTADGFLDRFRRWSGTWRRRPLRPDAMTFVQPYGLALFTGISGFVVLPYVQGALLPLEDAPRAALGTTLWIFVVLGLLLAVNGLLIDSYLRWSTPGESTVRRPVRWLRAALSSVPILGLWTIPLWRWLVSSRGHWVRRNRRGAAVFDRKIWRIDTSWITERLGRWASRVEVLVSLFVIDTAFLAWAFHLSSEVRGLRGASRVGALAFQGLLFVCMLSGLGLWVRRRRTPGWRRVALPALSVCWLVPLPALPLAGIAGMILIPSNIAEESLCRHAFGEVRAMRRLPGWLRLEERLGQSWRKVGWRSRIRGVPESVRARPEPSDRERRVLWFLQGKGLVLLFEAAFFAGGLWRLIDRAGPAWVGRADEILVVVEGILLCAVAVSLLGLARAFVRETVLPQTGRRVFGPRLFWGHLVGVQAAFLCGIELGIGLVRPDLAQAGSALALLGLGGVVLQTGALLLGLTLRSVPDRSWETNMERLAKIVLYASAASIGPDLAAQRPAGLEMVPILDGFRLVAPLVGVILGMWGSEWLCEPDTRQGAQRGVDSSPSRLRSRWLRLIAVVPLGGLATPWWIRREERRHASRV